jgi:hypothetical protein
VQFETLDAHADCRLGDVVHSAAALKRGCAVVCRRNVYKKRPRWVGGAACEGRLKPLRQPDVETSSGSVPVVAVVAVPVVASVVVSPAVLDIARPVIAYVVHAGRRIDDGRTSMGTGAV